MKKLNYVSKGLIDGESAIAGHFEQTRMQYAPAIVASTVTSGALAAAGEPLIGFGIGVVCGALFACARYLIRFATENAVTTSKLVKKTWLVARKGEELRLSQIQSVQVHQSIVGRVLGYGDVVATGTGGQELVMHEVVNPIDVKKLIEGAI